MLKNHDELIEATLDGEPEPIEEASGMDHLKVQRELTFLKSNIDDLYYGRWLVTEKKLHAESLARAKNIMKLIKAGSPKTESESSAPSMYYSWARKIHDQLTDAFPEMSQWATTSAEKAATQACRKALVAIKRAMAASPVG